MPPLTRPLVSLMIIAALGACATLIPAQEDSVSRGRTIFAAECSQCHGASGDGGGAASLGLGMAPPDLTGLTARNDGAFPRAFVSRFVLGTLEKDDPDAAMPEFGTVGLKHVYPDGTDSVQLLASDLDALLDYMETLQR